MKLEVDNEVLNGAVAALEGGNQRDFEVFVDAVVDFCETQENGKVFEGWDRAVLRQLVAYHEAKNTLIVLSDDAGEIHGVFMWYNCNANDQWSFVYNWEADKPRGDAIFMAFLFADSAGAFKRLLLRFIEREPDCLSKQLLGIRQRRGQKERVSYSTKLFTRILKLKTKETI